MARKFTDIEILESLVKQFGDSADASAWEGIRAKLEEAQPQADNTASLKLPEADELEKLVSKELHGAKLSLGEKECISVARRIIVRQLQA